MFHKLIFQLLNVTNSAVPAVHAQICPKFSLNILCKTSLPARMKMIQLLKSRQSGHKSMGIFSDAQEQLLGPIWLNFELFLDVVASRRNIYTFSQTLQPINNLQNCPTIT